MGKRNPNPLEGDLEESCRQHAKTKGWDSRKMNGLGNRDWPDRMFIPPQLAKPRKKFEPVLWVEFKRRGEVPTVKQVKKHVELRNAGQWVEVIDCWEDFVELFDAL